MTDELDKQIADFLQRWTSWTGQEDYYQAKQAIQALIDREYRKGYNDNSRDCYCDSKKAIESIIPHKHLMDDGESHDIRPDTAELSNKENTNE